MATKLNDLKITSTDLVDAGANPDAKISLFKRGVTFAAGLFKKSTSVAKEAETFNDKADRAKKYEICDQIWDYCYAFKDSLYSIVHDGDLDDDARSDMMFQSLDEFAEALRNAIPIWSALKCLTIGEAVVKCEIQKAAFESLMSQYSPITPVAETASGESPASQVEKHKKEEFNTMNIDKSKLTPEELTTLEAIEKKYGGEATPMGDVSKGTDTLVVSSAGAIPELHPEVKKALDENKAMAAQMAELQKSLEIKDLSIVAQKYEIIGKKADELAPKLYELKKAGGTAYDDFVGLLDEQVTLVEKSGLYGEIGTARSNTGSVAGSAFDAVVAEVRKNNPNMSQAAAIAKAYEENPELAEQYENNYTGGNN
ncbi:MAG: hypothetical protein FWC89_11290 [Defluviitaleaceae bacterium]|nr:hypothetical protein [Defluviitaleaceae bacterium]